MIISLSWFLFHGYCIFFYLFINKTLLMFAKEDQFSAAFHTEVRNRWLATKGLMFHVPNELQRVNGETTQNHLKRIMKAKSMGVVKGIQDHIFFWKGRTWAFELKMEDGRVSEEQRAIHLAQLQHGVTTFICWDLESALLAVQNIIEGNFDHINGIYNCKNLVIKSI